MTDMFLIDHPCRWIDRCFATMAMTPQHTHQVLTKRAEQMCEYMSDFETRNRITRQIGTLYLDWPLPNRWLGVSVENKNYLDERRHYLLYSPAALRFVSYEPALGPVDFSRYLSHLDWLIVGGESGDNACPFDLAWARSVITQCRSAGVAPFVMQLGAQPCDHGVRVVLKDRKHGCDPTEWPAGLCVREWPTPSAISVN